MLRQYFYAVLLVLFVHKLCYADQRTPFEQEQVLGKHTHAEVRENEDLKRQKNEKEKKDKYVTFREFGPSLDDVESTTISSLDAYQCICTNDFVCVQHPGTNYRYMTILSNVLQAHVVNDLLFTRAANEMLDIPWRLFLMPKSLVDFPRPAFLLITANDILNEIGSEHLRSGVFYAIRELLDYVTFHFKKEFDANNGDKLALAEEKISSDRKKHFDLSVDTTTGYEDRIRYLEISRFWTLSMLSRDFKECERFVRSNIFGFLFRIWERVERAPQLKVEFDQRSQQLPRLIKNIYQNNYADQPHITLVNAILNELHSFVDRDKDHQDHNPTSAFSLNLLIPTLIKAGKVKQFTEPQLVNLRSLCSITDWRDRAYLDLEHRKSFYYPDESFNFTKFLWDTATWEDIASHPLGKALMQRPQLFSQLILIHPGLVPDDCIKRILNINNKSFELTYINNETAVFHYEAFMAMKETRLGLHPKFPNPEVRFALLPTKIKEHYQQWESAQQAMQDIENPPAAPVQAAIPLRPLPAVGALLRGIPPQIGQPQGIILAVPPPAEPARLALPPLKGIERKWRYDPSKVRSATDEELRPLHEFRHNLLMSVLDHRGKELALEFLDGTEILAKNNPVICTELFASGNLYSQLFQVRVPRDLVLHPEQSDAPLEQRAFNSLAAIRAAWDAIKDDPKAQKHCIQEAFIPAPCYEAKTQGLMDWLAAYFDPTKPEIQRIMTKQTLLRRLIQTKIREIESSIPNVDKLEILKFILPRFQNVPKSKANNLAQDVLNEQFSRLKLEQERWRQLHLYEAVYSYACSQLEGKLAKDGIVTQIDIEQYLTSILAWSPLDFHTYMEAA